MHHPRLLFLDAYDSFSNNIIVLLRERLNASVETIHIDDKRFATTGDASFHDFLRRFDAVVAGPGPGDPRNPADLGLISKLWTVPDDVCLPVLGVCLGFQSLALAFGASVDKLIEPRHGLITEVTHRGDSLFENAGTVKATQYHSLHVRLDERGHLMNADTLWSARKRCPSLQPLAWDLSDSRNGPVLMALKHRNKPFWGVQYHPESICTNDGGSSIIQQWWSEALSWSLERAARRPDDGPLISASYAFDDMGSSGSSAAGSDETSARSSLDCGDVPHTGCTLPTAESTPAVTRDSSRVRQNTSHNRTVSWTCMDPPDHHVAVTTLLDCLQDINGNVVMLESGTKNGDPVRSETGRFSIITILDSTPKFIRYSTQRGIVETNLSGSPRTYAASMQDVWSVIEAFMADNRATDGPTTVPFWGGLVGFISYEAGLETIAVQPIMAKDTHPDVWFVFAERSVVVDHVDKKLYIQNLREHDVAWMRQTQSTIHEVFSGIRGLHEHGVPHSHGSDSKASAPVITAPSQSEYEDKVRLCQTHIRAGDSYELCLTDQSTVTYQKDHQPSAWDLYNRLRTINPAPFGAYLRFKGHTTDATSCEDLSILSSSPERFLSWSRSGKCQFRPIKGTVLKTDDMTREKAEAILNSDKERAENLMIVDLIRHDLHGVAGPGNVKVEKLMQVEEYETVYQLVSVIEGQLAGSEGRSGADVLAASLPPGSMTGAPKKRSCELLQEIEGGARSIYSGVMGYFDVGGGGDFSVIIRTAFRWGDEDCWRLGAGGAVTTLSTADGEFEEMMAKRASSLRAFQHI